MGRLPNQVIGNFQCHRDNYYTTLLSVPIVDDDSTIYNVTQCATLCSNSALASASTIIVDVASDATLFNRVSLQFSGFINDYIGAEAKASYRAIVCDSLGESLSLVYSGAALIMIGDLAEMGMLFWLGY